MKIKKLIAILLILIAVAMVGFGIYTMNSSKYIFKTTVSGLFDKAVDAYDEMTDRLEEYKKFTKYKLVSNNKVFMAGMDYATVDAEMYVDIKKNSMYINLDSSIMNEKFIGLEGLLKDNKLYAKVKEVMDEFYYESTDESLSGVEIEELSDEEFELMMNHLKDSILKDITDKDLVKDSATIKQNSKDVKSTKISLKISEQRIYEITKNLLTAISNDNKAIQILQKYDKTITKNTIEDLLKQLKENSSNLSKEAIMTLSFYVEGFGGLKRVEISTKSQDVDSLVSNVSVLFDVYKNKYKKQTFLLTVKAAGMEVLTLKEEYTNDTNFNVELNVADIEVTGKFEESKDKKSLRLDVMSQKQKIATVTYSDIVIKKDKEYKTDITIDISEMIGLTSTTTMLIDENVPDIDIDGAKLFDDMSEDDLQELEDYLIEKLEKIGLDQLFTTNDSEWETDEDASDDLWDDEYSSSDEAYDTFWYEETSVDEIETLMKSETPIILWMGSQYCSHCASFAEVLDDSYFDYDYDIYYIEVDKLTDDDVNVLKKIDSRLGEITTPTTLVLQDGKVKEIKRGAMTKDEYYSLLDEHGIEK